MNAIWVENKKKQHKGKLSVHNEELDFFDDDDRRIYCCERVRIKFIGPDGMMFTGFELTGVDNTKKPKYRYVEPYFRWNANGT